MADVQPQVQELLTPYSVAVRDLIKCLRQLVHTAAPDLTEEVKLGWQNIVYKKKAIVVAVVPQQKYAQLFFYKGTSLTDANKLLEGTGKGLRHIKIRQPDDIEKHKDAMIALIHEAVKLEP